MLTDKQPRGPRPSYPFRSMAVGDQATIAVPTAADVKRVARNASQYGVRHGRFYRCCTDMTTRVMTITRDQ